MINLSSCAPMMNQRKWNRLLRQNSADTAGMKGFDLIRNNAQNDLASGWGRILNGVDLAKCDLWDTTVQKNVSNCWTLDTNTLSHIVSALFCFCFLLFEVVVLFCFHIESQEVLIRPSGTAGREPSGQETLIEFWRIPFWYSIMRNSVPSTKMYAV